MASAYFKLRILNRQRQKRPKENTFREGHAVSSVLDEDNRCRVCLKEGKIPIFGSKDTSDISQAINIIGDIEIREADPFPKYICEICNTLLKNAILFRKCAKKSDILLRKPPEAAQSLNHENDHAFSITSFESDNNLEIEKYYSCKLCSINFSSCDEYISHKNSKKHKCTRVQCSICYRVFTSHLYKKHLARHRSASHLICEVCGRLYRKDNLVRHLQLHSYDLPYQCQMCPYRGRFMESLKIHMRTHTGEKPFSCDKCQLRFLTRSNLNRHLLTHKKERPYKCVECGRGFYTKRDLDVHFKSDHAGIKDFGCRLCGNKYGTRKALMRHELRVHKRDKMAKGRMPLYLQAEYKK